MTTAFFAPGMSTLNQRSARAKMNPQQADGLDAPRAGTESWSFRVAPRTGRSGGPSPRQTGRVYSSETAVRA